MSSTPKKPLAANTMSSGTARKPASSSSTTPRGQASSTVLSSNGVARTSSIQNTGSGRPTRPSARRPGSIVGSSNSIAAGNDDSGKDEDARVETAALIDSLKKSVRDAEVVSEDYQHQMTAVQQRLDDLMQEHAKLEEQFHESTEKVEELQSQARESSRHVREMETIYESERVAMMKDREETMIKESDLKQTIQRLKETMAGKESRLQTDIERPALRKGRSSGRSSPTDEAAQFAPSSASTQRSDSKGTSRLVMQKDQIIEGLRLELAEAQIKLVEMENMGGGHMRELERTLLETRMTNARLMEDNESFQLLLGEKTLNGDFQKGDLMQAPENHSSKLGSLAEELESAEGEGENQQGDNYRRLEADLKSLRDQNKALTLYIEKIISRVLQHENFETILDQKPEGLGNMFGSTDKDLPPPPPVEKDDANQSSFLGRAISVARRQRPASQMFSAQAVSQDELTTAKKPRPQSQIVMTPPDHIPTANEDPTTAPSIPLGRAASVTTRGRNNHRRTQSELSNEMNGAAAVINQMYRGPSRESGGPITPMSPGGSTPRSQYFGPNALTGSSTSNTGRPTSGSRTASGLRATPSGQAPKSASESTISHESGDLPSPPRNSAGNTTYTGAVMTQNKLRPLRLVQGDQEAQKKANRGSWMGWFNKGKDENSPRSVSGPPDSGSEPSRA